MTFVPAKRVQPYNLWIGSEQDSANQEAAERYGVTLVVNATRNLPKRVRGNQISHIRVPVDDTPDDADTMLAYLMGVVRHIDTHLLRGGGVLVHCYAGISRSASVAAAYVMYREGLTPAQAIARVRQAKPETFGGSRCSPNFMRALDGFHAKLMATRPLLGPL